MARYKNILKEIKLEPGNYKLQKLLKTNADKELKSIYVPQEYIDFLTEVGFGSVFDGYFMFYDGLIEADEIYDADNNPEIKNVLLFGDNFSGDAMGFLPTKNWSIVEIWHDDLSIVPRAEKTFREFIDKVFLKDL